jgi:hypothetical protein
MTADGLTGSRGIGLFEVIAGTLIATIAVIGLAYSFGVGRGLIDRYQVARAALGEVQHRMDSLTTVRPVDLRDTVFTDPFDLGTTIGSTTTTITWADDPADGLYPTDTDSFDVKRATVDVSWTLAGMSDHLRLERVFLGK